MDAPVITVDGPSGVGKGTLSQHLAEELNWWFLDSGALYRLTAYAATRAGLAEPLEDHPDALAQVARGLEVAFPSAPGGGHTAVWLAGADVTEAIRSEACGVAASRIAALPPVRAALLARQRGFCRPPGLVADGRDMGTVVFPDAELKIYLWATAEERARRRYNQLRTKGISANLTELTKSITARDSRDANRSTAPLKPALGAVVIDTTQLDSTTVYQRVIALVHERLTPLQQRGPSS